MTPTPNSNSTTPTPAANPFAGLQVQASGTEPLPAGAYFARFIGVEPFSNDKVTDKFRWRWEVVRGTHTGREATSLTDRRLTPFTHAGRLIAGLIGRPLTPGEDVGAVWASLQAVTGQQFMVTVQAGPKGGKASVQNVSTPPEM